MHTMKSHYFVIIVLSVMIISCGSSTNTGSTFSTTTSTDHSSLITDYQGAETCFECHSENIKTEIMSNTHYTFSAELEDNYLFDANDETQDVKTRENNPQTYTGKFWKLCGFPTAVAQSNWLGKLRDDPDTDYIDGPGGCARCHIGIGFMPAQGTGGHTATASQNEQDHVNIDCLVCHAANYTRRYYLDSETSAVYVVPKVDGEFDYSGLLEAAQSVGHTSATTCLRCHASMGGGSSTIDGLVYSYKRGMAFDATTDVHAAAGMTCANCHSDGNHKVKRAMNNDLTAYDSAQSTSTCLSCHDKADHPDLEYLPTNHEFLEKFACETCHATSLGGVTYKDFSDVTCEGVSINNDPTSAEAQACLGATNTTMFGFALTKFESTFKPVFKWFNGKVQRPIHPLGSSSDGKIYPFKKGVFNQPVDADGNAVPFKAGTLFTTGNLANSLSTGLSKYTSLLTTLTEYADYGLPDVPNAQDSFAETTDYFSLSHGITKTNALGKNGCTDCHGSSGKFSNSWDSEGLNRTDPLANVLD